MKLRQFFLKNPFFRMLVSYAAGLFFASLTFFKQNYLLWIILSVFLFLVLILTLPLKIYTDYFNSWIFGLLALTAFALAGIIHGNLNNRKAHQIIQNFEYQTCWQAKIIKTPEIRSGDIRINARLFAVLFEDSLVKTNFKLLLYISRDSAAEDLSPGDKIICKGTLQQISPPENPEEFNYQQYLLNQSIYLSSYINKDDWSLIPGKGFTGLLPIASKTREHLLGKYKQLKMSPEAHGLLAALTLGYRGDIDSATRDSFARAGIMHIIALSGLHVGIIAVCIGFIIRLNKGSRQIKIIKACFLILILWMYAVVTGLSPSVIRATSMITVVLAGKLLNRRANTLNILFVSAFFMLALKPGLIRDLSFQLSFTAVTGILLFQPYFNKLLIVKNSLLEKIWQLFTVSCAAQTGTLPLTLAYFHQFPVYFWLCNLFAVPLATLIICTSWTYLIVSGIKPLAIVTGKILNIFMELLLKSAGLAEKLPGALADGIYISTIQTILLFAILYTLALYFRHPKKSFLFISIAACIAFLSEGGLRNYKTKRQKLFVVNKLNRTSAYHIVSGKSCLFVANPDSLLTPANISYSFENFRIKHGIAKNIVTINPDNLEDSISHPGLLVRKNFTAGNILLGFYDKSIVLLINSLSYSNIPATTFKTNIIIVTQNIYPDIRLIKEYFSFDMIIIDSSCNYYRAGSWEEECKQHNVFYHNVSKSGAFILKP